MRTIGTKSMYAAKYHIRNIVKSNIFEKTERRKCTLTELTNKNE